MTRAALLHTLDTEMFVTAEVSTDLVRLIVVDANRKLLLMWDMTREQAGTLTAIIDGRLDEYVREAPA